MILTYLNNTADYDYAIKAILDTCLIRQIWREIESGFNYKIK